MRWQKLPLDDGAYFYTAEVGDGLWIDINRQGKRWRSVLSRELFLVEGPTYRTLAAAKAAGTELAREYLTKLLDKLND